MVGDAVTGAGASVPAGTAAMGVGGSGAGLAGAGFAPGNGRGTAPVVAQPAVIAAKDDTTTAWPSLTVKELSV